MWCNFLVRMLEYQENPIFYFFSKQKCNKTALKSSILMAYPRNFSMQPCLPKTAGKSKSVLPKSHYIYLCTFSVVQTQRIIFSAVANIHFGPQIYDSTQPQRNFEVHSVKSRVEAEKVSKLKWLFSYHKFTLNKNKRKVSSVNRDIFSKIPEKSRSFYRKGGYNYLLF